MSDEIQDKVSTPEELADIKAQLAEEQKAVVARDEAISERDAKLAELETALSEAKKSSESLTTSLKEARDQAVAKYLDIAKTLNPTIPQDIIVGGTIAEIDASIERSAATWQSIVA